MDGMTFFSGGNLLVFKQTRVCIDHSLQFIMKINELQSLHPHITIILCISILTLFHAQWLQSLLPIYSFKTYQINSSRQKFPSNANWLVGWLWAKHCISSGPSAIRHSHSVPSGSGAAMPRAMIGNQTRMAESRGKELTPRPECSPKCKLQYRSK